MAAARRVRPATLLGAVVAVALVVASWSATHPALAALGPGGFAVTPLTNTYDDPFYVSVTGNPVTDSGLVAGSTQLGRYSRAAVYDLHRHTMTVLGTLGGRSSTGTDVNSAGDVVGYSDRFHGETHAFLWTARTGVMHDLGAFDGRGDYSQANAVNDAGVVVGWGTLERPGTTPRAFVWDPNVTPVRMRELPLPVGGYTSTANAVNTRGQVVGRVAANGGNEGFLWDPATAKLSVLGSLPGARIVGAADISDSGLVVGPAEVSRTGPYGPYTTPRSYRWNPATRAAALLVATPGAGYDEVLAINRHGIIVGTTSHDRVNQLAVWNECGTPVYVQPAPDGQGSSGAGVNRYGQVVGASGASPTGGAEFVRAGPCLATP